MAAMTANLTPVGITGFKRELVTDTHTVLRPEVVTVVLKPAVGNATVSAFEWSIKYKTQDAAGDALQEQVAAGGYFRTPINGLSADRDAVLVLLRDMIASDEFGLAITGGKFSGQFV